MWYVVCDHLNSYEKGPERDAALIWTLSRDPRVPGWNTDCGCPGYGLTRADADELAHAANAEEML